MGKLSVRSAIAVSAIRFDLEDEVQTYFDDKADEFDAATFEKDCGHEDVNEYLDSRYFSLEFYNFKAGCGDRAVELYKLFDHSLMTYLQAWNVMNDMTDEFIALIESNGGEILDVDDYTWGGDKIVVNYTTGEVYEDEDGYEFRPCYTAYVAIEDVLDIPEHHINALDDRFWNAA